MEYDLILNNLHFAVKNWSISGINISQLLDKKELFLYSHVGGVNNQ